MKYGTDTEKRATSRSNKRIPFVPEWLGEIQNGIFATDVLWL
jgi:hypothetical protein